MALAAYGKYSKNIQKKLDKFLSYDSDGNFFKSKSQIFIKRNFSQRYSDTFVKIFGKPRLPGQKITKFHKNLAFNVQFRLEAIVKLLVIKYMRSNEQENLCLAGGVHMNCKLNGELSKLKEVKNIFIQPASSDNGVSLGAAIILAKKHEAKKNFQKLNSVYYGPEFSNKEVLNSIKEAKLNFRKSKNIFAETAKYLSNGKIVGWFQGRSEVGARALGNRSILANPMISNMRYKLNKEVKHRELWRPFCPSVNDTHYKKYFNDCPDSPYMILALPVKKFYRKKFNSSVHVDGTARPQVVTKKSNIKYWKLLNKFGKITGHPILINTSFNIQGEPIVNTPSNAISVFLYWNRYTGSK